ncbi:peroxidase-related enzyme [Salinarimonas chemoclinalis]|uniref:peroxidase-related enzyme n=1 Tax=Salinarimonas chemoclinalis TaxID=3241599 RepID=UPI003555F905
MSEPKPGSKQPLREPEAGPTALDLPAGALSPEMRGYLDKCAEKIGFVPNVLAAYAHDDAKLSAFAAFYNGLMLAPSGLTKLEREMIAVVVSAANRCFYCVTAHGAAVRQLSGDPVLGDTLGVNWRAARLAPRHVAMLAFAEKVALASSSIAEVDRQALRDEGFTDVDVWDVAAVASFFAMSNRLASATDMRPNAEYHVMAR